VEADPDAQLMLRLKNGEDWILNELMTRWQQPLVAFIYRYIGHETEALDLAQETFVRIFRTRDRYTVRGKFSTWLFAIASNLCRNHLRSRQRRRESVPESWEKEEPERDASLQSPDDAPDEATVRSETVAIVKKAISKLPHDLRTVILLYEYQGLSYDEIASAVQCSVKAVEMRLYRARNLLRESLSSNEIR
jgi:RNA polymerase sigma-70 factor, ECF subfamily